MGYLIQYIAIYAPWIYAICGLVALYHIYRTWQVRSERRQALFSLEREKALRDLFSILFVSLLLLVIMGVTYFSSEVLARAIQLEEPIRPLATPTDGAFTPLPTLTATPVIVIDTSTITGTLNSAAEGGGGAGNTGNQPAAPAVVQPAAPEPPATPEPPAALAPAASCPDNRVQLSSPGVGEVVSGQITVSGTANHDQFNYYKLEYAPGANADGGYAYHSGGNSRVINGVLGSLNTADFANGTWTLQLVVVDLTGNFPPPCRVTVTIQN